MEHLPFLSHPEGSHDPYDEIFRRNQDWVAEKLNLDPDFFKKLGEGQSPDYLYIGCSDSRVTAEELMGMAPGEVFVHRNVANMVIQTDANLNAVVQYAVEHLKVKHIIVCGHYGCGGVKAALNPSDLGQLNPWIQTLRDVYRLHRETVDSCGSEQGCWDLLVELNVMEQCINVMKIDHVQRAWYKTGFPKVHGWVFDTHSGHLHDLKLNMEEIASEIRKIYDLKPD